MTGHSAGKQIIKELTDTPAEFAFDVYEIYTVYADGSVELEAEIERTIRRLCFRDSDSCSMSPKI